MSGNNESVEIACFVVLYLIGLISLIMQTYCIWILVREKRAVYFLKRHYKTIYWNVGLTYSITLRILLGYTYDNYIAKYLPPESIYGRVIFQFWGVIPSSVGSKMLTLRLWLYYYDLQLNKFNRNKEWRMIIDPKNESKINNIFVKYHQKFYTNETFLTTVFASVGFIESIILSYVYLGFTGLNEETGIGIGITLFIIEFGIINGYLIFGKIIKTEQYGQDSLGLKHELSLILIAISWVAILVPINNSVKFNDEQIGLVFHTLYTSLMIILQNCFMAIFVIYPRYYYNKNYKYNINKGNNSFRYLHSRSRLQMRRRSIKHLILPNSTLTNYNYKHSIPLLDDSHNQISWTKLVSFYDGFEAIMTHLAKEFSTENLLLVQEYVQVKKVLGQFFNPVLTKIYANSKKTHNLSQFNDLPLPPTTDQVKKDSDGKCIPESAIAKHLRKKLLIWTLDAETQMNLGLPHAQNGDNIEYNMNKKIDIKSKHICDDIIVAFSQIYNKYINGDTAIYMINVSSRSRRKVEHLFDTDYYYKTENAGDSDHGTTPSKRSISFSFKFSLSRSSKQAKQGQDMYLIKQQLKNYLKQMNMDDDGTSKTEFDLIEWLLQTILLPMDDNFLEIIFLMNDSFLRFKSQNKELFDHLCQHLDS